jgi:4a-hydroxytetrahydrobiopterin dehydratase
MNRQILKPDELSAALTTLNGWTVDGNVLKKRLTFPDFAAALELINQVGELADAADHHPDITFGWGYAELTLTTHDRGGITDVDVAAAREIDKL